MRSSFDIHYPLSFACDVPQIQAGLDRVLPGDLLEIKTLAALVSSLFLFRVLLKLRGKLLTSPVVNLIWAEWIRSGRDVVRRHRIRHHCVHHRRNHRGEVHQHRHRIRHHCVVRAVPLGELRSQLIYGHRSQRR